MFKRLVIVGGTGFLGREIGQLARQSGWQAEQLGTRQVDLEASGSSQGLARLLAVQDCVVYAAAITPSTTPALLARNLNMAIAATKAISEASPRHLIVVSSDAVYGSQPGLLSEETPPMPDDLHGVTHLAREMTLATASVAKLSIVRPSAIYGSQDPHNAYGPNRFVRAALREHRIPLLGHGRSIRDHVSVNDVASIVCHIAQTEAIGVFNAVSGVSLSFADVSKIVQSCIPAVTEIVSVGPETSPTSRYYDSGKVAAAFPTIKLTPPEVGIPNLVLELSPR